MKTAEIYNGTSHKDFNFYDILTSYIRYYNSDKCIACDLSMKDKGAIFSSVYHDDLKHKSVILKCKSCGMGYTYPFLSESELGELYVNYDAHPINEKTKGYVTILLRIIKQIESYMFLKCILWKNFSAKKIATSFAAQHLFQGFPLFTYRKDNKKIKVLDFGCGEGYFLILAKNAGCDVYGVEVEGKLVKKLNSKGIIATRNLEDFLKDGIRFDIIRVNQVFEHIKDPSILLLTFHKLLKENGELIIGVPNFNTPAKIFKEYFYMHLPYHRLHYTKKSMELILNKNKFSVRYRKTKSYSIFSSSLLDCFKMQSSYLANVIRFLEIFVLSIPFDIFKTGDCMEIYAQKRKGTSHVT